MSHDFIENLVVAARDIELGELLRKYTKSPKLVHPDESDFIRSTCEVIDIAIEEARNEYTEKPSRLRCLISDSNEVNAFAFWPSNGIDWVVLTTALLAEIRNHAEDVASRLFEHHPELQDWHPSRRITQAQPICSNLQTGLSSFLYVAGVSFFIGHEAGHHLEGHDGHYSCRALAESDISDNKMPDGTIEQALEIEADGWAVVISRRTSIRSIAARFFDICNFDEHQLHQLDLVLSLILHAGSLMALALIKPRAFQWQSISGTSHPPAALRALRIVFNTDRLNRTGFTELGDLWHRWASQAALEIATQVAIGNSPAARSLYEERVSHSNLAGFRAIGLHKMMRDPKANQYLDELISASVSARRNLRPRKKPQS